ncbi:hypothetical protein SAMN05444161_6889 [Rhizobiales bacterium GAS191]|nr:hypothetical protein SAMN05444161_6889 [Rhizobiales bacterium GAS191]
MRLWGPRGELVSEPAVCNDLSTAIDAYEAATDANRSQLVTLGQQARILYSSGREPLIPAEEKVLRLPPPETRPASPTTDKIPETAISRYVREPRKER